MRTMSRLEEEISDRTAFDVGEKFESEQQVRDYFRLNELQGIFGDEWAENITQEQLDEWADDVIEHRWHMVEEAD